MDVEHGYDPGIEHPTIMEVGMSTDPGQNSPEKAPESTVDGRGQALDASTGQPLANQPGGQQAVTRESLEDMTKAELSDTYGVSESQKKDEMIDEILNGSTPQAQQAQQGVQAGPNPANVQDASEAQAPDTTTADNWDDQK